MSLLRIKFEKLFNESPARVCRQSHITMNKLLFKTLSVIPQQMVKFLLCHRVKVVSVVSENEKYRALKKYKNEWWMNPMLAT